MEAEQENQPTFTNDLLERNELSQRLERYLEVDQTFVEGSLVVSLDAPFGSGKTTFLKMWEHDLNERRENGDKTFLPIFLNAWESDFCADPLASLLCSLIEAVDGYAEKATKEKLIEAGKQLAWFGMSVGNDLVAKATGLDLVSAGEFAKGKTANTTLDFLDIHKKKIEALNELKAAIKAIVDDQNMPPILFFVDELDRCKPDFAIHFLETIKHVFDINNLTFLLAVDLGQLKNSAKSMFGNKLDFTEYYRKFSHRTHKLPVASAGQLNTLVNAFAKKYLYVSDKRNTGLYFDTHKSKQITELLDCFEVTPRQAESIFRSIGYALASKQLNEKSNADHMWGYKMFLILCCVIKEVDSAQFAKIKEEENQIENFALYLCSKMVLQRAKWWFSIYITGFKKFEFSNEGAVLYSIAKNHFHYDSEARFNDSISRFFDGWGQFSSYSVRDVINHLQNLETEIF